MGELNEAAIKDILYTQRVGRLVCIFVEQPYIIPITYVYDGTYVYGQTNEGTKLEILRYNTLVNFEVDRLTDTTNWESVIIAGQFEELHEIAAAKARQLFLEKAFPIIEYPAKNTMLYKAPESVQRIKRVKDVVYRINIETIKGVFEEKHNAGMTKNNLQPDKYQFK